jgi:hypothetical protein
MIISDPVYGKTEINEPIILELIKTATIQRLKGVSQSGLPDKYYKYKNFSRFEHSLGVMILLKRLGATLETQVAGLLHDVSILAFSHVADILFGQGNRGQETYHDSLHEKFIHQSEIPQILKRFGFTEKRISNPTNFSLLDNEIPNLCADRVDYTLREFYHRPLNPQFISQSLSSLTTKDGKIVFNDQKAAFDFASSFLRLQTEYWGSDENVRRCDIFASVLKKSLKLGIIHEKDFYGREKPIVVKVKMSQDKEIVKGLKTLADKVFKYQPRGEKFFKKFRHVNPKVIVGNKLILLTQLNPKFSKLLEEHRTNNLKGIIV